MKLKNIKYEERNNDNHMKENSLNLDLILKNYTTGVNKRYIYRDKNYDDRGIDYIHFIKLRLSTINNNDILNLYSPEGWHMLWYLMTRAKDKKYIKFTPNMIIKDLNTNKHKVFKGIEKLFDAGVIYGTINNKKVHKCKSINDIIEIIITYLDNELYTIDDNKGFKAIPFDFVYRAITDMNEYEWGIYTMLIVRHRYFKIEEIINQSTGEIYNVCNDFGYAYPSQDAIGEVVGVNRKTAIKYIKSLENKGYISTVFNDTKRIVTENENNKPKIKNMCYQYYITLLNRPEYMKYHILNMEYNEKYSEEEIKLMETKTIEELLKIDTKLINDKVYIKNKYSTEIKEYHTKYNVK